MPNDQASYRTLIDEILGSAVDSDTWTTTIKDEALRSALRTYDRFPVYETSFEVTTTGEEQDLSTITALDRILAVAYPWPAPAEAGGADFDARRRPYRHTDAQKVYFEDIEPQDGEYIRVRYTKEHAIKDLDSAAATTVPTEHTRIIGLLAAAHACTVRYRQVSENPAIPRDALLALRTTASALTDEAHTLLATSFVRNNPAWPALGL